MDRSDEHLDRQRRRLVTGGAVLGGLALAGCAAAPTAMPSPGRVVVVGGGFGGATAARYLRLWGNVDVTLVERQAGFVSCPMSNLVLGGFRQMGDISRGHEGLRAAGVKVVQGEAAAIDLAGRSVRLVGGAVLPYDRLVLSPGVDFIPDQIAGLETEAAQARFLHAWKAGPQTVALRRQLEAMPDGGVFALAIPKAPYRCPPGPYERACVVAAYLQQAKPRSKVLVLDANPEIQSKKALFEKAFKERYGGIVEYRPNSELKQLDAASGVAKFEFEDIRADVMNAVPPQRAGDIARAADLVNVNGRWVGVNWLTMESTAAPGVHVLGDATFSAPAMPKSGHMANQHAKVAAAAIIASLKGEPVNPAPVVANTCYSFVSGSEAIHVASVHQYDAAQKTLVPVPGAGGVSAAASAKEALYAQSWANNVWADTLGG
jgi:NADPH-dependent 2,4-dienoyl-CoA reductase/sulfur reductase-like enzyme